MLNNTDLSTIRQRCTSILTTNQSLSLSLSLSLLQGFQEQMVEATGSIGDTVKPLATAAKGEAEKLGHQVTAMANLFPSLAGAAIGAASKTTSSQMQTNLLEQTKTLTGENIIIFFFLEVDSPSLEFHMCLSE